MARKTRTPRGYHPVVLIQPHSTLCSAVATQVPHWTRGQMRFGYDGNPVKWDLTGRRNDRARHTWLVCRCSAPGCSAELAVYWERVHEALGLTSAQWVGGRQE